MRELHYVASPSPQMRRLICGLERRPRHTLARLASPTSRERYKGVCRRVGLLIRNRSPGPSPMR